MKLTGASSFALAAFLSVILILSMAYYWPIQEAYHPLNSDWNGCSQIVDIAQNATMLFSYEKSIPSRPSLLAIIGPSIGFTKAESAKIGTFLETGGTVLLADDFGTGNELLRALNVSALFSEKPIADLYYYSRDHSFPIITNFSPSPATKDLTAVVLNRPSYIEIGNSSGASVIATSSPFSFIDLSGLGKALTNETISSYPVIASVSIGEGTLLMVADPGMFINDMINLYDNVRLFRNMLNMGGGLLFFDVTHLAAAPLTNWRITLKESFNSISKFTRESTSLAVFVVIVLILGFTLQLLRLRKLSRKGSIVTINLYTRFQSGALVIH